ncbi:MAG: aminopeptidase [Lachnospiraceae bacterium]|nr:aminopeptidase [Lachnospiraceae bacterium]
MSYRDLFMKENSEYMEKYELAKERICGIVNEESVPESYRDFFKTTAEFILYLCKILQMSEFDKNRELSLEELKEQNYNLYKDIMVCNYNESYANPEFMENKFGESYGKYLCYLYMSIRKIIPYAFTYRVKETTIYMELFIEIYNIFEDEELSEKSLKETIYWFESDYTDVFLENRIREQLDLSMNFYYRLIMESDLSDLRYLYCYGKYVSENELKLAKFVDSLSEDEIDDIAATFTEGFRRGFIAGRKDLSIKDRVEIRYPMGFEKIVKSAIKQFNKMGLKSILRYDVISTTPVNKQMSFDHKFDHGLFYDKAICDRKLAVSRVAFEKYKKEAALKAGPAVIETFGEAPFSPANKKGVIKLDEKQRKISASYENSYVQLYYEYIKGDETSFTIIAYPIPEIGEAFEEIFVETIKINNLDEAGYREIQQSIIDVLDTAEYVTVKGQNGNVTDMRVELHTLKYKEKETLFENCTADVNIPVGEVFTSPKLKGTKGVLNVSEVYLNGLKYTNLLIKFEDGMIKDYSCDNFKDKEECRNFVRENLLQNRETLPIGEFAIGTNTTAYVMANKYDIVYKLPILIVEKMGPHFAVGDTCYSFEEDSITYNPDGKAIVARENEVSALRKTDMEKAYFGIHTDITIPYDEIAEIAAVRKNGEKILIISNGRFVLKGTEKLNIPFENN